MKYQVVEISKYLIYVNEYNTLEEAITCFQTKVENAKEYPMLKIKKVYLTIEHGIAKEWANKTNN